MPLASLARHPLALVALCLVGVTAANLGFLIARAQGPFAVAIGLHIALYLVAVWWVFRRPHPPAVLILIVAVAVMLRLIAFPAPQVLTTDAFRYVWDGRIQWHGFNPYLWIPAAEELRHLRDADIYPNIFLKERAVTVYPPVAELLFLLGHAIQDSVAGVKAVMMLAEGVTIWAILRWLAHAGLPRERVLVYAWHPLPLWEFTGQAHIDAAATAFLMLAILAALAGRQGRMGMILAVAVLTKYFPLALVPALWRRWDWRAPLAFTLGAIVLYLPYAWHAGSRVIGFLGNLIDREGYLSGHGFHLIWIARDLQWGDPSGRLYIVLALVILAGLCSIALFRRGADEIRPAWLVMLAFAFIWLTSPHHVWYFGWIIPLLCRHLTLSGLSLSLLACLYYVPWPDWPAERSHIYLAIFGLPLAFAVWEAARATRRQLFTST